MVTINGKTFEPSAPVPWDDAIAADGFYYHRARSLGLPEPTALLFDPEADGYLQAMGRYHGLFRAAEARTAAPTQRRRNRFVEEV
jgi:hypothetical protein